ncbi:hypothetical protein SMU81_08532 [Streptococcus mutans SF14]|nr:hypothetical protein SMU9_06232 [Streptococcus mutans 1ID3]EMC21301.1 hypothetical protein SMU81_08532 [Streptococcus mutans SF14]
MIEVYNYSSMADSVLAVSLESEPFSSIFEVSIISAASSGV